MSPRPSTRWRVRSEISWRIHDSSDAGLLLLGLDVDALVVVLLLGDQRQVEPVRVGASRTRRCGRTVHCIGVRTPSRSPR